MENQIQPIIITIIVLRISQLFVDYNFDRADQYWQGSQIAYKMHYGYGYLSWEWTMDEPIRSPLYQIYLSIGYFFCDRFQCSSYLKEIAPKIMQILLSIICDWFLIKTASYYVKNISYFVGLLVLTNWYYFSMLNRIYINSAQTCLVTISFYFWVTREQHKMNDYISRFFVMINFSLRPTSLFLWAVIWPYQLLTKKQGKILFILKNGIQIIILCLFSILVGTLWYGKLTWIDFNFFKYNVFLKFSELYGVNSFLQYFYITIPVIMASYLIPLFIGIKQNWFFVRNWWNNKKEKQEESQVKEGKIQIRQNWEAKKYWELFILTFTIILFLSLSTHKQTRFLLVVTPFLLILSIKGIQNLTNYKIVLFFIIVINLFLFSTLTLSTKTGGIQILRDLRSQIDKYPVNQHKNITVMYLCQPHSLPYLTILQRQIDLRLIDTSPFRKLQHFNEQVQLKNNPYGLYEQMAKGKTPQFIIIQQKYTTKGAHLNQKYAFLLEKGYTILSVRRNINFFQLQFLGWDGFALLKKV